MSLLPSMAQSTAVSVPAAGAYISAYALGVVFGAPLIAILFARSPRKALLLRLLLLFTFGYTISASAWSYETLLIGRFVAGLPHGAYYGVASLVAAAMVAERRRVQAISYVMIGLAAANVVGVPAATWLGQALGWRSAFLAVAGGATVTALLLWKLVPSVAPEGEASPLTELRGLFMPQVWLTLGVASIGFGGMFAVYSYITPTLVEVTKLPASMVPLFLAVWGLGMVIGNLAGGWLADRWLVPSIFGTLVWNMVLLTAFWVAAARPMWALANLFLIGVGFALVPALQARLMRVAGSAQTLAAALNHSAFNASNAIGAALGGLAISHGYGWTSTSWVAGGLALGGLVLMIFSYRIERSAGSRLCHHATGSSSTPAERH
ncbi:UNVERIFIED_ORG: DHA1 family inner membrane transport protein [Variovorax paradoxus]|nr:DHA1 family inner membrane transport protein [Variovorax paradoxus]